MNEPIQDKAPKPAGLLPKNVQSWLIVGLAVLMVLIMWLTGGKRSTTLSKGTTSFGQSAAPVEVNEAKITDLQSRIQQLQREQTVAQSALAQSRSVANPAANSATSSSNASAGSGERAEDVIQAERKKREYLSLFASNIAVTYRKNPLGPEPASAGPESRPSLAAQPSFENPQIMELLKQMQPAVSSPIPQVSSGPTTPRSTSLPGSARCSHTIRPQPAITPTTAAAVITNQRCPWI